MSSGVWLNVLPCCVREINTPIQLNDLASPSRHSVDSDTSGEGWGWVLLLPHTQYNEIEKGNRITSTKRISILLRSAINTDENCADRLCEWVRVSHKSDYNKNCISVCCALRCSRIFNSVIYFHFRLIEWWSALCQSICVHIYANIDRSVMNYEPFPFHKLIETESIRELIKWVYLFRQ